MSDHTHRIPGIAVVHTPATARESGKIGRFQGGMLEVTSAIIDSSGAKPGDVRVLDVYRLRIVIEGGAESVEIEVAANALRRVINAAPREDA